MEKTLERIQYLCDINDITIAELERNLGYGNGSLKKPKSIKNERLRDIAEYFDVSVDYLVNGDLNSLIHLREIQAKMGMPNNLDKLLKLKEREDSSGMINEIYNKITENTTTDDNIQIQNTSKPYEKDTIFMEHILKLWSLPEEVRNGIYQQIRFLEYEEKQKKDISSQSTSKAG